MSRHFNHGRLRDEDLPASPDLSRMLILGFLVAGLLGFLIGLVWVGWHLLFVSAAV
jgi:hypothetical protein